MKNLTFCMIAVCGLFCSLSSYGQNIPASRRVKIEREVDSVFHVFIGYAEKFDIENLNRTVDDRYKAGFVTNGIYYSDFNTLMEDFRINVTGVRSQKITIQKEKISVITEKVAILTATGSTEVTLSNGESRSAMFYWSFVLENINNNWKVLQSHQSTVR